MIETSSSGSTITGDRSFILSPSLSYTGRYIAEANGDFVLLSLNLGRNVDVDIKNVSEPSQKTTHKLFIPKIEFLEEGYKIPWSQKEDAFYALTEDSLFKFFPNGERQFFLSRKNIYDFSVSPTEQFIFVFANDSIFLYDLKGGSSKFVLFLERMGLDKFQANKISLLAS